MTQVTDLPAWTLTMLPLDAIQRLPRNPKDHDVGLIYTSIYRFGFVDPIVVNRRTGNLIAGHGRDEALQIAVRDDREPPDGIEVHNNVWHVPTFVVDVAPEEEEPLAIALNRSTEAGGWDHDLLAKVLSDLATQGEDALVGVGYDMDDVNDLLRMMDPPDLSDLVDEFGEPEERDFWPVIRVQVSPGTFERWSALMELIPEPDEADKVARLLNAVDETLLDES